MDLEDKLGREITRTERLQERYDEAEDGTVRSIVIGQAIGKARARIANDDRKGMKASIRELHELE